MEAVREPSHELPSLPAVVTAQPSQSRKGSTGHEAALAVVHQTAARTDAQAATAQTVARSVSNASEDADAAEEDR